MSKNQDFNYSELDAVIEERGKRILERFRQVAVSGVSNPELLSILEEVKDGWRDTLRSALTSFSCEAVGGRPETADNASLMFTLAAAGIGIHDDIIDRSSEKHFRATVPGLHGLDNALLVGDLLIVKAWTVVQEMIKKNCQPEKIAKIVEIYGNTCVKICEAEIMEISCRQQLDTDIEYYKRILWMANADLEACTKLGAILGDGSEKEVQALAEIGKRLGFMLRLTDDVKDCLNIRGTLPHRIEYESVPLPLLYTAKSSKEKYLKIKFIIDKSSVTPLDVEELLRFCFEAEAFDYICGMAKQNEREAINRLRTLKNTGARNVLALIIRKSFRDVAHLCL